ncbi:MAG: DUF2071 domain-containing protein [Pirellulaceae bacterium]
MADRKVVLRAFWSEMVALNFQIDPQLLEPFVPSGLEVDTHQGAAYVSLVCATCKDIRIFGLPLPISRGYKNVFLRCYVKRENKNGKVQHGSVSIKAFVSSGIARWTISKSIKTDVIATKIKSKTSGFDGSQGVDSIPEAEYQWFYKDGEGRLKIKARHRINNLAAGTKVGFILKRNHHFVEHLGTTYDFPMQVTPSNVWDAGQASFHCDTETMFGREFAKPMSKRPISVFLAEKNTTYFYAAE